MKTIKQTDIAPQQWSGGKTWTYYIAPATASLAARDFDIRISSASVEIEQSTFSDFSDYTRYFSVLTEPVILEINGAKQAVGNADLITFCGADAVTCYGKTRDINVFVRNGIAAEVAWQSGVIKGPVLAFADNCLHILQAGEQLTVKRALCLRSAVVEQ